ncbi:uncharacterized protein LOC126814993 [Patella vulgata]|uniref:uncharacterized protein LOC126814993 n=1 Tax=Patella vulgata TaxID=6465 RepID=UPI00217F2630|nr:uncharacterized protein LOC126814993 [Patella vulgata]XP_050396454.1 uncharacterized protein LOC126814993 [Patella vulgata]
MSSKDSLPKSPTDEVSSHNICLQHPATDSGCLQGSTRPVNSCNDDISPRPCPRSSVSTSVYISGNPDSNRVICSHTSSSNSYPDDDWMCTLWGYIFCCNEMTRYKRTQILWMWISVLSIFIGLTIALGVFGINKFDTAPKDMRIINHKYSTIFCHSLTLHSDARFRAYRFTGNLIIAPNKRNTFNHEYTRFVESGGYVYFNYYVLTGSYVNLVSCSDDFVQLYIIKGQGYFDQWKTNKNCSDCYLAMKPVNTNGCFLHYNNYSLSIQETDTYYFVFMNRKVSTWVTANFHVIRTVYDLTGTTRICNSKLECRIPIEYNTDQRIMYHISPESVYSAVDMSSKCEARLSIYLTIFVFGSALIGLTLTWLIYIVCSDPKRERILPESGESLIINRLPDSMLAERTPLFWKKRYADPPKYEDIFYKLTSCTARPPSYDEIDKD